MLNSTKGIIEFRTKSIFEHACIIYYNLLYRWMKDWRMTDYDKLGSSKAANRPNTEKTSSKLKVVVTFKIAI